MMPAKKTGLKMAPLFVFLLVVPLLTYAQDIFVKGGNIFFKPEGSKEMQLTASGKDSAPTLSPDGKSIVFVRDTPGVTVSAGAGDENATELWLVDIGTRKARLLLRGKEDPRPEKTLAGFESPCFSPDGNSVYFVSAAWAVSGAIQKYSISRNKVQFVTDGVSVAVIDKGKYKGYLLVDRALIKYDRHGESLGRDIYRWLVSPEGKLVKEIGQSGQLR